MADRRALTTGRSKPPATVLPRTDDTSRFVRAMFTRIAGRYDLMNALMTGGRHHAWRRTVAEETRALPPGPVLDLATGTGDLALAVRRVHPDRPVVAADFSEGMLREAARKLARRRGAGVVLAAADALALPFPDGVFAAVVSAFLLRNLADLERGLAEMRRVLRPGGRMVALDIVSPRARAWRTVFDLYFNRVVPAVGTLVAGDRQAYTYLPQSVARFVAPDELARLAAKAGFARVAYRHLALGTIAIHTATAPEPGRRL